MHMRYILSKNLIYGLLVVGFISLGFGGFAHKADAQYSQYYYSSSTTNNASDYARYRQLCPADFTLTVYNNNQYMCYKFLSTAPVGYQNPVDYNFNPALVLPNLIPGCLPGYAYSQLTGESCDGSSYSNSTDDNLNGRNGTIRNFEVRSGNDDNPQEGDNNAEVMKVRFDIDNGDIRLDKAEFDFQFTGDNASEDMPWNTFDEVRLLSNGEEIARVNTDSRGDWNKEDSDTYSLIFSGLDEIIRENDTADLTLEADINSSIDGISNGDVSWDIFVPDKGIRARDGNGNTLYTGNDSDNASITIEQD